MRRLDDPSITDEDSLYRRILPSWVVPKIGGGFRPSSSAFLDNRSGEVSVNVARLTTQERVLATYPEQERRDRP